MPFPRTNNALAESTSAIRTTSRDNGDPAQMKMERGSKSLHSGEQWEDGEIKVEKSSSPLKKPKSFSQSEGLGYVSQWRLIKSNADKMGLDMSEVRNIMSEKDDIANTRFPDERDGWQAWFAESLVWSFYCEFSLSPIC